jgi:DNA-binding NarL/FixJ family response regulator
MKKLRILVVDDHPLARFGVINQLESVSNCHVVGEAEDGAAALKKIRELHPDVVILDLFLPGKSGFDVAQFAAKKFPSTKILVLTGYENEEYILEMTKANVAGYILKTGERQELEAALKAVAKGEKYFSQRVSRIIVENSMKRPSRNASPGEASLTEREREILVLVAQGLTNQQIGDQLYISPRTVDTHRTNIMRKLDLHDVAHLVRYAMERGITHPAN